MFTVNLDVDVDLLVNSLLGPIFSSWNGSTTLLDVLRAPRAADDVRELEYKVQEKYFHYAAERW